MSRRSTFRLVLALVGLLTLPILSAVVFSLLDADGVFGLVGTLSDEVVAYCGRFVPGVRFAVNVLMGMTEYPYRRFLVFSAIGGTAWSLYTCVLAYLVSTALADLAVSSIAISGLIMSALVGGVYRIDRRRTAGGTASPAVIDRRAVHG